MTALALERFGQSFHQFNGTWPVREDIARRFMSGRRPDMLTPPEVLRLVQGTKCPTRPEGVLRLERRDWSQEYRLRFDPVLPGSGDPPINTGERVTQELTARGAKALADSCAYVSAELGGYCTFLTLTVDAEKRAAIDAGELTLQREVSRFFDAAQKMYRRGWVPAYFRANKRTTKDGCDYVPIRWNTRGIKIGEHGDAARLAYCWVAENPVNDDGERNPHVHVLLAWRVPWSVFPCWSHRLERGIWKQGFAHLERMKEHKAAGYYMAKAAGYLTKAQGDADQGPIHGNRYGIAAVARAPGWYQVEAWAADACGEIIKRARMIHARRTAEPREQRDNLKAALQAIPKTEKKKRQRIGRLLERARKKLDIGWYATKFGVVIRDATKYAERLSAFVNWMKRHGWTEKQRNESYALALLKHRQETFRAMREHWRQFYAGFAHTCEEHWKALREFVDRWEPVEPEWSVA